MTTAFQQRRLAELRRRTYRRVAIACAVLALPTAAGVAALSPLLDVDRVRVEGARRLTPAAVEEAARVGDGPLALVDTAAAQRRLVALPGVKRATVTREWPSSVVVTVVERVPVVAVPRDGRTELYDVEGVLVDTVATAPASLPRLAVPSGSPSPEVVGAAVALLRSLPRALRREVRDLTAAGPAELSFHLADGAEVVWGDSARTKEKVRALTLLVPQKAKRYDVRVPDRPAVTPR
ncbi:MAG TPA: FtsQ-type POTRA domain-containing protein [Frankiaceae bacterium]|nr:FtsQ-type POTRA domain-containing protein [Frankiaceae bacterium]